MTVQGMKGEQVNCFWTDSSGAPNDAAFPVEVLQKF
jgi:hypothetical protein